MLISTEAIALSSIKYSETSIIVKCLTQSDGVKSYLIRGVRSQKKKYFKYWVISAINNNRN
jgi:DNA repair protein RecO (recombination protein O)